MKGERAGPKKPRQSLCIMAVGCNGPGTLRSLFPPVRATSPAASDAKVVDHAHDLADMFAGPIVRSPDTTRERKGRRMSDNYETTKAKAAALRGIPNQPKIATPHET